MKKLKKPYLSLPEVKILSKMSQTNLKHKASMPTPKDKEIGKKSVPKCTQTTPTQLDPSPSSKTLIVSDEMEYNIIDDMKKNRENITFYELIKLKHLKKSLLKELKAVPSTTSYCRNLVSCPRNGNTH